MANHKSSEKRARQTIKRQARNTAARSEIHHAERKVLTQLKDPKAAQAALSEAFSVIQKSRGVLHVNAIKRKMARLATAVYKAAQK